MPSHRYCSLLLFLCLATTPAIAQVTDDFSDGDFTTAPAWTGTTDRWTITDLDGNPALQSDGVAASDTIYLATPSEVSRGTWAFTFAHRDVNLSNFNGARVFLMADRSDLSGEVFGYYLQLGTNNSDEMRLYRLDGDPANRRVELGRSDERLGGDANTLSIIVSRSEMDEWTVTADGDSILMATDGTYATSRFFGVWVKHTQAAGQSYYFDDFDVQGTTGPTDTTPPVLTDAAYTPTRLGFLLTFSEPLDEPTIRVDAFEIGNGVGPPVAASLVPGSSTRVQLDTGQPLTTGTYPISISGIADLAGNAIADTTVSVSVVTDTTPPHLLQALALDATTVRTTFDEPVFGCFPERYAISNGIGAPSAIAGCTAETAQAIYELQLPAALQNGRTYTLTIRAIADEAGNVLDEASADFSFSTEEGATPQPGDVVINEVMYDPPPGSSEYVELYNRSDQTFDLRDMRWADSRLQPVAVSDAPVLLPPDGYAVLVADGAAFRAAFPGMLFVEPASWPALNNGGDTPTLLAGEQVIDAVPYTPGWGGDGVALERRDPAGPSGSRFNFGASTAAAGGTPGAINSLFAPDVTPPILLFAEQVTANAVDVYASETLDSTSVQPGLFTLADGQPAEQATILDSDGAHLRLHFGTPLTGTSVTASTLRDLTGNVTASTSIPLAYLAAPGDIIINEIMYDPGDDDPEYFELLNPTTRTRTLRHHYWTDVPNAEGTADTLRLGTDFLALAPEGFAVVFADPAGDSSLVRAFPETDFTHSGVTLIPIARSSLSLVNSGDLILLHRPDDTALDSVFYDPDWHHPNLIDAGGASLERIAATGDANDPANWTSSVVAFGGTPGLPNAVAFPPGTPGPEAGLLIEPSPFSPDRDGRDDVTTIQYTLEDDTALIRVRIFDQRGRLVRTLEDAALAGRSGQLLWDGLDDEGRDLHIGIYVVLLEALNTRGGTSATFKEPVVLARPLN